MRGRMSTLGFDGDVIVVPGAGGGMGRCHALELARRGARVVVNDLGGHPFGGGSDAGLAEAVVEEIRAAGGGGGGPTRAGLAPRRGGEGRPPPRGGPRPARGRPAPPSRQCSSGDASPPGWQTPPSCAKSRS